MYRTWSFQLAYVLLGWGGWCGGKHGSPCYGSRPPAVSSRRRLLAAAGDLEPGERAGQRGHRPRVVDLLLAGPAAGQPRFGTVPRALGSRAVDVGRGLGDVGQDDDLVVAHLGEPAGRRHVVLVAADAIGQLADAERGQQRRVARQHAEITLAAR